MSAITPTVGRKVWYYTSNQQAEPIDATVVKVTGEGPDAPVNLNAIDPDSGVAIFHTNVRVGDETTEGEHYRWMPYQSAQAAKAEASAT
jgi:hypothetical protein